METKSFIEPHIKFLQVKHYIQRWYGIDKYKPKDVDFSMSEIEAVLKK